MALVAVFNALVDPYGTFGTGLVPTAIWSDRTTKVGLIDALKHAAPTHRAGLFAGHEDPAALPAASDGSAGLQRGRLVRRAGRRLGVRQSPPRPLSRHAPALPLALRCRGAASLGTRSRPHRPASALALLLREHPPGGQSPTPELALFLGHGVDVGALAARVSHRRRASRDRGGGRTPEELAERVRAGRLPPLRLPRLAAGSRPHAGQGTAGHHPRLRAHVHAPCTRIWTRSRNSTSRRRWG